MNRRIVFALLLIAAVFMACNKPVKGRNGVTYKNPVQYNDYIISRQSMLMKKVIDFGKVAQSNLDSADKMLNLFVKQTDEMIDELKGMPAFKRDSSMRDAAVRSFAFYKKVFNNDYRQIIQIRKREDLTMEESDKQIGEIVEKLTDEEARYDKALQATQRDFAERNNMKLKENELQKEFNKKTEQ